MIIQVRRGKNAGLKIPQGKVAYPCGKVRTRIVILTFPRINSTTKSWFFANPQKGKIVLGRGRGEEREGKGRVEVGRGRAGVYFGKNKLKKNKGNKRERRRTKRKERGRKGERGQG